MTTAKLVAQLRKRVAEALAPHAEHLYQHRGERLVALVELEVCERVETTETDEDGTEYPAHTVKLRVSELEVASGEHADHTRRALRALWANRTADGTLDESVARADADRDVRPLPGLLGDHADL